MAIPRFEKLRPHLAAVFLLLVASATVYGRLLWHDFQNVDDQYYVTLNPVITGFSWQHLREVFSAFYVGNYAPIQMLSYMLDYTLWGMWSGGFLLGNILIHSASGLLVYRLSLRFHGDRFFSTVAAGLFLLHPVQVESVAWISQRKTLLAMLFFLVAWEYYCRYREGESNGGKAAYVLSLSAFVLSLLSKSIAVILPVVLVMFDYFYPQEKRRVLSLDKIPFVVLAGTVAVLTIYGQQPEVGQGGRVEGFHGDSASATFYTMLTVLCRYLGMMAWPASLSAEYNPAIHDSPDTAVLGAITLLAVLTWGGWRLYRYDRRLGFWPVFLLVALLPVSQIIPLYTLMNDRYLYFPMLSVAFLGGSAASALLQWGRFPKGAYLLVTLAMIIMSVVTYNRAGVWRDPVALWTDAVSKVPDSSRIWGNLGDAHAAAGDRRSAIDAFERGLELNPDNIQILYNYGNLSLHSGDKEKAYVLLKRLLDQVPDHVMGLVSFGDILLLERDFARAERSYLLAHQWQPDAVDPLIKLGNIAVAMQRLDDARDYYLKAEKISADHPDVAYNIACVEALSGRLEPALLWLEKALQRGFDDEYALRTNQELEGVRADGRFERLLRHYFPGR